MSKEDLKWKFLVSGVLGGFSKLNSEWNENPVVEPKRLRYKARTSVLEDHEIVTARVLRTIKQ